MGPTLKFDTAVFIRALESFFREEKLKISHQHMELIVLYFIDLEQLRLVSRRNTKRLTTDVCCRTNICTVFSNLPILGPSDIVLQKLIESMINVKLSLTSLDKLLYKLTLAFTILHIDKYLEMDFIYDVTIFNNVIFLNNKLHVCERAILAQEHQLRR